jgi:16S rRNA (uracil1498-N3)-methyltransferase
MNSIILSDDQNIITDPKVLTHLHQNLKLNIGDEVRVTLLNKGIAKARVQFIDEKKCQFEILSLNELVPSWIDLVVGISRPQTMKKILEHASTFGVSNFHFYKAELSEKSYLDSKIYETESINELLDLGLSQSALYATRPNVQLHKYNPASLFEQNNQKFILDLSGDKTFLDYEIDFKSPIMLSIGPERGFIKSDIELFHQAGFKSVKISSSILRVEHAVYSAISQLELLRKQF